MAKQKTAQTSKLAQRQAPAQTTPAEGMRLDKWLWCARFHKTRALAAEEIAKGRVVVNGIVAKASRELRVGDTLILGHGVHQRTVQVRGLSAMRGPAAVAQTLYEETPESLAAREQRAQLLRLAPEPADMLRHGRPTKKDRRELEQLRQQWDAAPRAPLDARWSARMVREGQ